MFEPTVTPSEVSFSPQTVCVWASGVYIARALLGASRVPNTKAEVMALAADSGVPDGSSGNYTKLAAGMKKRYGLVGVSYPSINPAATVSAVMAAAKAGPCAVAVSGDQYNLTPHWQSGHVGHSIAVLYQNGTTGLQLDPLAPAGYPGDPFPPTELGTYARAALIFKEEVVVITIAQFPTRKFLVKAPATVVGSKIDLATGKITPGSTIAFTKDSSASADSTLTMNGKVYLHVIDGGFAGQYISNPAVALTPPPKPITQEDVAAARAAGIKAAAAAALLAK